MLIKLKDDVQPTLDVLEGFLARKNLSGKQREWIEAELDNVRAGARGEKEAAYHIDFKLEDAKNYAVIHDLRLEHEGRVAQIDHLVIGRRFDLFVIESKSVKTALRVNQDGEFEVKTRWGWKGMASPVEQNKRHIQVLSDLISQEKLTPTRLGLQILPTYRNWVLIPPECNLFKKKTVDVTILKMDMFDRGLEEHINDSSFSEVLSLAKVCSSETVMEFARKLVSFHRPILFDYVAKFGIATGQQHAPAGAKTVIASIPSPTGKTSTPFDAPCCQNCETSVEPEVVSFCRSNQGKFEGKILCRNCQTTVLNAAKERLTADKTCDQCGMGVDAKVVAFCRFSSRRFEKRVLCRGCQVMAPVSA